MTLAPTTPTPKSQKWWQKRPAQILIAVIFVAIVVFVVSRSIKPEEFEKAFKDMQPLWFIAAFAIGTLTWVGAAIPMKVFAPSRSRSATPSSLGWRPLSWGLSHRRGWAPSPSASVS